MVVEHVGVTERVAETIWRKRVEFIRWIMTTGHERGDGVLEIPAWVVRELKAEAGTCYAGASERQQCAARREADQLLWIVENARR